MNDIQELTIKELLSSNEYRIPIYQRNYAWGVGETTQLIQDIADYIGVGRTYLYKIFMREAQISPKQYLLQYRIRAAAKLLQTQNYNVTEIAYSCGFRDSAAFCYHFRQQIGMTPRQYREKIRSGTY